MMTWLSKAAALSALLLQAGDVQAFSPIASPHFALKSGGGNFALRSNVLCGGRVSRSNHRGSTGLSMKSSSKTLWRRSDGAKVLSQMTDDELTLIFRKLDTSGKGVINNAELTKALTERGVMMTDYEFMTFLGTVDRNVDGQISLDELQLALEDFRQDKTLGKEASWLDKISTTTDAWREGSRRYKRTVFLPNDWTRYRRSTRLLDNLLNTWNSSVLRALWFNVLLIGAVATSVWTFNHALTDGVVLDAIKSYMTAEEYEPEQITAFAEFFKTIPKLTLPLSCFTLSSPSLSLLLVFRTNNAFQRFFEARALWGSVINYSRNCAAQGARYLTTKKDIEEFCRRTIVFSRSLKLHLRYESDKEEVGRAEMERLLGKKEADRLLACAHRPCQAITDLGAFVRHAGLSPFQIQSFDKTFEQFHNQLGACERIFKTPLPLIYTRHTSRFLTIWCGMLPFALYNEVKGSPVLIPIVAVIAAFLLGIEELGVQIAEPFSVLALENMCDGIEASCKQIVAKALEADDEGGWEDRYVGDAATTTILPPGVSRDQFNYAPVEKAVTVASFDPR